MFPVVASAMCGVKALQQSNMEIHLFVFRGTKLQKIDSVVYQTRYNYFTATNKNLNEEFFP